MALTGSFVSKNRKEERENRKEVYPPSAAPEATRDQGNH